MGQAVAVAVAVAVGIVVAVAVAVLPIDAGAQGRSDEMEDDGNIPGVEC